jgi:hypothetical protein
MEKRYYRGDKPKQKEWTEAEKQALVRLVRDGAGTSAVKAKLRRHAGSVRRMALEMNLVLANSGSLTLRFYRWSQRRHSILVRV